MKAAFLPGYRQDYVVETTADPEPPGPGEIIVKVGAAGVCRTDLHIWHGDFRETHESGGVELPVICGHETAGWVDAVGVGVTHLSPGDPILLHMLATCGTCLACRAGDDMHCTDSFFPGIFVPGGFAQYVKTNARAAVPLPEGVTPLDVAPLGCAGITAYRAVKRALPHAAPGTYTVILGAGGLGHIGIQALRAQSATEIIVIDQSARALSHAKEWGADHTVQCVADGSHIAETMALTRGKGADVVLDFIGEGGRENDGIELVGVNGIDILVGYGGEIVIRNMLEQLLWSEKTLVASLAGNYVEMVELVALVQRGAVKLTATTYPLEQVTDAIHALDEGRVTGRALLLPNG